MILREDYLQNRLERVHLNLLFWKKIKDNKYTVAQVNQEITRLTEERKELRIKLNELSKNQQS